VTDPHTHLDDPQPERPSKLTPEFLSTVIRQLLQLADMHPTTRLATAGPALSRQLLALVKEHPDTQQPYSVIRLLEEVLELRETVRLLQRESVDNKANAERYVWYRDRVISEMAEPVSAERFDYDIDQKRLHSGS